MMSPEKRKRVKKCLNPPAPRSFEEKARGGEDEDQRTLVHSREIPVEGILFSLPLRLLLLWLAQSSILSQSVSHSVLFQQDGNCCCPSRAHGGCKHQQQHRRHRQSTDQHHGLIIACPFTVALASPTSKSVSSQTSCPSVSQFGRRVDPFIDCSDLGQCESIIARATTTNPSETEKKTGKLLEQKKQLKPKQSKTLYYILVYACGLKTSFFLPFFTLKLESN